MLLRQSFWGVVLLFSVSVYGNDLVGRWVTPCGNVAGRHSAIGSLRLEPSGQYDVRFQVYETTDCQTKTIEIKLKGRVSHSLELGGSFYKDEFERRPFDHFLESVRMKLLKPDVVALYNKRKACGFDDWKLNRSRSVSGKICEPFAMPVAGRLAYDLILQSSGALYFGGFPFANHFSEPDARPKQVIVEWPWLKQ